MKVTIKPPTELEAQNIKLDASGVSMEPTFYQPKGKATAGVIEVATHDGKVVFRGLLTVHGKTGVVEVDPRTKPVSPALDVLAVPKKEEKGKK